MTDWRDVALAIVGCYAGLMYLNHKLFPPPPKVVIREAPSCQHHQRMPWDPESSVGDESDYQSRCTMCAMVLRDPPNAA